MTASIHVFAGAPDKFFVNSFIIEGEAALVLVDTQFLVSSAVDLCAALTALGKPLAGVIVTHPHPDHFNGLPTVLERFGEVPVFATQPTIDVIAATQAAKRAAWTPVYGSDYPTRDAAPTHVVGADETFEVGGVALRSVDLGPGESADITILHVPEIDALIASDLIYHKCHPWLAEHRTGAWLEQIERAKALYPTTATIYPGHGPVGDRKLFDLQRDYILEHRAAVAAHAGDGTLDAASLAEIGGKMRAGRDGWPLDGLIDMNSKALAEELHGG